jgi:hypothetical protein
MSGCEHRFPKTLIEFQGRFASEGACAGYLFERRWPQGLSALDAATDWRGCCGPRPTPMNVPGATGRLR